MCFLQDKDFILISDSVAYCKTLCGPSGFCGFLLLTLNRAGITIVDLLPLTTCLICSLKTIRASHSDHIHSSTCQSPGGSLLAVMSENWMICSFLSAFRGSLGLMLHLSSCKMHKYTGRFRKWLFLFNHELQLLFCPPDVYSLVQEMVLVSTDQLRGRSFLSNSLV